MYNIYAVCNRDNNFVYFLMIFFGFFNFQKLIAIWICEFFCVDPQPCLELPGTNLISVLS